MRRTWTILTTALLVSLLPACAWAQVGAAAPASAPAEIAKINGNSHKLTAVQEQETLDFLKQTGSAQYARLVDLRKVNPETYQSTIRAWYVWMEGVKRFPPDIQQAFIRQQEANTQLYRLAAGLKIAGPQRQDELLTDIRAAVTEMFDAQVQVREYRLQELRSQLAKLQEENDKAKANRDELIRQNVQTILKTATQPGE